MTVQTLQTVVVGLQTYPIANVAPTIAGELLTWNGASWQPGGNANVQGSLSVQSTVITGGTVTVTGNVMPASSNTGSVGAVAVPWNLVAATTVTQTSDPRLKKDIQKIPGALALVMSIPPKTFRFKSEPNDGPVHWGFLTTDVQETMGKGFAGVHTDIANNSLQALAYNEMIAILWRAVQELSDEVAELHEWRRGNALSN